MPEAVARFGCVFAHEVWWSVAIIAASDLSMARLEPTAVLLLHDVAIDTRLSVVGHVGIAAGIDKGVGADADGKSDRST